MNFIPKPAIPPSLPWHPARAPDFGREVHGLLGVPVDAVDMAGTITALLRCARGRKPCFLSTPNLNFLVACQSDAAFRRALLESDLSIADGMPLLWMARLLDIPLPERVAGAGLLERLRQAEPAPGLKVFLLGGPPGAAKAAAGVLGREAGGLCCVGFENPGFGSLAEMSTPALVARINQSGADFLILALGARKGQAWILHNRERLTVPLVSHLGAAINFLAGTVRRAPAWIQAAGLEWLWRIKEEPALGRRYWRDGLAFNRLLVTRVLPYALFLRRHRPVPHALAEARLECEISARSFRLRLFGAWARTNLGPLRQALDPESLAGRAVILDLADVAYVDSAFIGLLMLLYGYQARQGQAFVIAPIAPAVRTLFKYAGADYLL